MVNVNQPLASIHPGATIGKNVTIEPFVTIHDDVEIGEGTWIGSNVVIHEGARIGKYCRIFPGAIISSIPQDLKFNNEYTTLEIGDYTTIREFATLNRGTDHSKKTSVGNNVLVMAYAHIAHDCYIRDNVIIANAVNLGGHVIVDEYAIIGGMCAVHQFVTIGRHAIISGGCMIGKDVPPFTKAARRPLSFAGINSIGLRRRQFPPEKIRQIQEIYRIIFLSGMNRTQAVAHLEAHFPATLERDEIISFIRNSRRGIMKGYYSNHNNG